MLKHNGALTALPLIVAACVVPACASDMEYSEGEADGAAAPEQVDSASAPLVRVGGDRFWPDGHIKYCFWALSEDWKDGVQDALMTMSQRLPLTFEEISCGVPGAPLVPSYSHIFIKRGEPGEGDGGTSEETGMEGGRQKVTFWDKPSERLATHELLHAIGLYHEQVRTDRDSYVDINLDCIDDDREDNYEKKEADEAHTSGVYDYRSIMHYRTGTWCDSDRPAWCDIPDGEGGTACATMLKEDGSLIPRNDEMSREDVNSIYYMYSKPFPASVAGDSTARSVAVGDFDGDGYSDVAVGLPMRTVNNIWAAGEVRIYKGTSRGLYPWQTLNANTVPFWGMHSNERFGWALAAGNLDNSEGKRDELVVGVPNKTVNGLTNAGAVIVFSPNEFGMLQGSRVYKAGPTAPDVPRANALFGYSLAIGPIAKASTVSGFPDETLGQTLAIGAPGTDNGLGAVHLHARTFPSNPSNIQHWTQKISGTAAGGRFGSALAIGNLSNILNLGSNNGLDLVVGSPDADGGRGQVDVFSGSFPTVLNLSAPMVTHWETLDAPEAATGGFGESLAIGQLRGDGTADLAVGAPETQSSTGAVYVYQDIFELVTSFSLKQTIRQNGAQEAGDRFGVSLAVANVDPSTPQDELLIGAPGENSDAGAISIFRGGTGALQGLQMLQQSAVNGESNAPNSYFGYSLAAGNINGLGDSGVTSDNFEDPAFPRTPPDVVVGSPYNGSFTLFFGKSGTGLEGVRKF